jgi:hypothetical protein
LSWGMDPPARIKTLLKAIVEGNRLVDLNSRLDKRLCLYRTRFSPQIQVENVFAHVAPSYQGKPWACGMTMSPSWPPS